MCLPNRGAVPFTPLVCVVVRTNCAIAYICVRDNATMQYARLLQPRMHLSASRVIRNDIYITSAGSLPFFPKRARARARVCQSYLLKIKSCMRLSRCEARSVPLLTSNCTDVARWRFAGIKRIDVKKRYSQCFNVNYLVHQDIFIRL